MTEYVNKANKGRQENTQESQWLLNCWWEALLGRLWKVTAVLTLWPTTKDFKMGCANPVYCLLKSHPRNIQCNIAVLLWAFLFRWFLWLEVSFSREVLWSTWWTSGNCQSLCNHERKEKWSGFKGSTVHKQSYFPPSSSFVHLFFVYSLIYSLPGSTNLSWLIFSK